MPLTSVAQTAQWTAAARAFERTRPEPLFDDPYAAALAGPVGTLPEVPEVVAFRDNPFIPIRTRFFDDWLLRHAATGLAQVVLLAAGMDTRAFRLAWPAGLRFWEVDQPALFAEKEPILAAAGAHARCPRTILTVDLQTEELGPPLVESGLDRAQPVIWLAEGLFEYLDAASVEHILGQVSGLSAQGSQLALDMLSQDFLESSYTAPYLKKLAELGAPWTFGSNEPEALLARFGWTAVAHQPGETGTTFGRWPFPVAPREVPGVPRAFFVTASRGQRQRQRAAGRLRQD